MSYKNFLKQNNKMVNFQKKYEVIKPNETLR